MDDELGPRTDPDLAEVWRDMDETGRLVLGQPCPEERDQLIHRGAPGAPSPGRHKALLGHSSIQTTQRYAHLAPDAHDAVEDAWSMIIMHRQPTAASGE